MEQPTQDERSKALEAIVVAHPDAEIVGRGPSDSWVVVEGPERVVYLTDGAADLPAGGSYTTWMVAFHGGEVVRVSRFTSTACSARGG